MENSPIRIAYIEDHIGMRELLCNSLERTRKISVVFDSDDGYELMDYLRNAFPLPDICLLDINMPKVDGLTILKLIRKQYKKMPCLIYSMFDNPLTIAKAISEGANGYLTKKHGFSDVLMAINRIMEDGCVFTRDADEKMFMSVLTQDLKIPRITNREREFIRLTGTHLSYEEIAQEMGVSRKTVHNFKDKCYGKLEVNNRASLVMEAIKLGIVSI